MNIIYDLLRNDGSIITNKNLINAIGLDAAVLFGELLSKQNYYEGRGETINGWFYETADMLEINTGLSYYQQRKTLEILINEKLIEISVKGLPAKKYFRVTNDENIIKNILKRGKVKKERLLERINNDKKTDNNLKTTFEETKELEYIETKELDVEKLKNKNIKNSKVINNRDNNNRKNNNREIIIDNNTSEQKKEKSSRKIKSFDETSDPYKLALYQIEHLRQLYLEMKLPQKKEQIDKWALVFDLMIRIDKRSPESIYKMIDDVYVDEFWSGVCLSPSNLRKNWDKIIAQKRRRPKTKQDRIREENEAVFEKFLKEDDGEDDKEGDSGAFEAWFRSLFGMEGK